MIFIEVVFIFYLKSSFDMCSGNSCRGCICMCSKYRMWRDMTQTIYLNLCYHREEQVYVYYCF